MFVDEVTANYPRGGKDNIQTTILNMDKTLETNEVCFYEPNIVTWFQDNEQNGEQRTREAFFQSREKDYRTSCENYHHY